MRNRLSHGLRALTLVLLAAAGASAEVVLPALLGDHMVIQRRQPVHIWGRAAGAEAEVAAANHPNIRFFKVSRKSSPFPATDAAALPWQSCTPQNAGRYSAIAYFFARELQPRLNVPVGIIDSYWGGTFVEAWMSLRALASSGDFMPAFGMWGRTIENYDALQARRERRINTWKESVARAKAEGRTPPELPWEQNQDNADMPAGLYNAMIAPLTPFAIAGAIWYQGESNASPERVPTYAAMFGTMIRDWRREPLPMGKSWSTPALFSAQLRLNQEGCGYGSITQAAVWRPRTEGR